MLIELWAEPESYFFHMLLSLFLAALIFSFANGAWLLRRMETAHHAVWAGLGRPTVNLENGAGPRLALIKYIWSLRFRQLGDVLLSLSCWMAIASEMLLVALFLRFILGAA